MQIGGLVPFSASDYPGCLAAVVFCQGCPWRCAYCHNPHLLPARTSGDLHWDNVLDLLARRRGLLDAVVFSGGEPTLQANLLQAVQRVKAMGFKVGLHTAGMYPRRLQALLPWLDWVGMDIKAPFAEYAQITGVPDSGVAVAASARLLVDSGVTHEFRTTVHSALTGAERLTRLADELAALGAQDYVLQPFRSQGCASDLIPSDPFVASAALVKDLAQKFHRFSIRGTA